MHVLNALEANWANIHSLSFGTFSFEGVMGIFSGRAGVGVLSGQVHLASMSPHLNACEGDSLAVVGKGRLMTPKSSSAVRDRNVPLMFLVMYTICLMLESDTYRSQDF